MSLDSFAGFDLSGKLAVVTGARRGIGRAIATALAFAGADIIGVSANLDTGESDVGRAVRGAGRGFTSLRCDFADRHAVAELAVFLAAPASDYVHGALVPVDGGWLGR